MKPEIFLNGRVVLHCGDSREVMRTLPDNSIDALVGDPPYALVSIVKRFANSPRSEATENTENPYGRTGRGFMGQKWDNGETAFSAEFWAECLRVLKPGGHLIMSSGTRTYHRLACAVEDAGFEIRDMVSWIYGSGFPKSHDVSKGIDRAAGIARKIVSEGAPVKRMIPGADQNKDGWEKNNGREYVPTVTVSGSEQAAEWEGWGTALKPACEPCVLARKPLSEPTVAANVLRWRTGALNIGACKVGTETRTYKGAGSSSQKLDNHGTGDTGIGMLDGSGAAMEFTATGRWPANVVHDGSEEVVGAFPDAPGQQQDVDHSAPSARTGNIYGKMNRHGEKSADSRYTDKGSTNFAALPGMRRDDSGSAARFFYAAKADGDDRLGSKHPTVKPVDLMQYFCRLVTPKGGTILDPFAGTGTTGEAAFREGFNAILIEREVEYQSDIRRRMKLVLAGPDERARESIKAKTADQPIDAGPLFQSLGQV